MFVIVSWLGQKGFQLLLYFKLLNIYESENFCSILASFIKIKGRHFRYIFLVISFVCCVKIKNVKSLPNVYVVLKYDALG